VVFQYWLLQPCHDFGLGLRRYVLLGCIEKVICADDLQANCNANPGFHTVASGGDGDNIQYWFVGYSTTLGEIIVSHQGTNPNDL